MADKGTASALANIENVMFAFDSWGLTVHQPSQRREDGGFALPLPQTSLAAQASLPLTAHVSGQYAFPHVVVWDFQTWAKEVGLMITRSTLPLLQVAKARGQAPPQCFLASCFVAFSSGRQFVLEKLATPCLRDLPVWPCAIFHNSHQRTYFAPGLARKHVLTIGRLLDDAHLSAQVSIPHGAYRGPDLPDCS